MHSPNFGLMGPSLLRANVLSELKSIQFLELQVHDNLKHRLDVIPDLGLSTSFGGYVTLHGVRRILSSILLQIECMFPLKMASMTSMGLLVNL